MANIPPPQPHEPRPNVRPIIGPNPTAGLVEVFAQIDEYKRKERIAFLQMLQQSGGRKAMASAKRKPHNLIPKEPAVHMNVRLPKSLHRETQAGG